MEPSTDPKLDYTGLRPLAFVIEDARAKADASMRDGKFEAAAVELGRLATLAPRDLSVWLKLGYARARAGRPRSAAEAYLQAAAIYAKRGYSRHALTLGRRALQLDPVSATPARMAPLVERLGAAACPLVDQAARTHLLLRNPDAARELLRLLLRADPSGLDRRFQLIEVQLAEGDWVEAVDHLYLVAEGLLRQGRIGDYIRAAEMALRYGGPNTTLLRQLARVYRRSGQRTLALAKLELLRRVEPDDPEALEALARARIELSHVSSGVAYLERLVDVRMATGDRAEVRALLDRVSRWSEDETFAAEVERIRVGALIRAARPEAPSSPPAMPVAHRGPRLRVVSGFSISGELEVPSPAPASP